MITYFIEAFHNLAATKLRTLLAMLGILVGTASVVAMVSSGELATQQALAQFKSLGTDMLAMTIYTQDTNTPTESTDIQLSDVLKMPQEIPAITSVAPYTLLYAEVTYGDTTLQTSTIGATQSLQNVIKIKMLRGRFVSDLDKYATYCVIGKQIYEQLAPQLGEPIGKQIKVGKMYFTIVGVADDWQENSFFNQDINNSIIIPINAASLLSKYSKINNIVMRLSEHASINHVENKIRQHLLGDNTDKKIFFRSAKEIVKSMTNQHKIFTWLLGLIGSVSLIVGGIGVMNIMLVSVLERRREIGIRLALGAKRSDIQHMFLSEAVTLSVAGGILGILLGILISFIIAQFAKWQFAIFLFPVLAGFTVSVLTGIFFGFYPALQAAKLDPIETLRIE
jgi:putative ABC transport system permease protein